MRALLWAAILGMMAWCGWWWYASDTALKQAEAAFPRLQQAGWQADHSGIALAGFPNRIDLTVSSPRLSPPDRAWTWTTPFVQVFALTYKPWHLIAAFADGQSLETALGPVQLTSSKLQASLVLQPGTDLVLDRVQLAGAGLRLGGALDLGAESLAFATRTAADRALAHDIGFELRGITPPAGLTAEGLPPAADLLRIDAQASLSAPIDRHAGTTRPQLTALTLREMRFDWGPIRLHAAGQLAPDAAGLAQGDLTLRIEGGREALALATAAGLLTPDARTTWEGILARMTPNGQPLELPLKISDGLVKFGPFALGVAPRLASR